MMNEEQFKSLVAKNLIKFRKINNLTQLELAEKLNYSDKAISKWERGESLPDLYTLSIIANFYNITIYDLTNEEVVIKPIEHKKGFSHIFITLLSVGLVWFLFTVCYTFLTIFLPNVKFPWELLFLYAVSVSFIVTTVFTCLWYNNFYKAISVSLLVWSLATSVHVSLETPKIGLVYFIALSFQILVILWFTMICVQKRKKNK